VKELFDPLKEGTPLNELRKMPTEELTKLRDAVGIEQGKEEIKGEVGFTMLAYNMRRVINIFGVGTIINLMKK
jgi:hypothetical protein